MKALYVLMTGFVLIFGFLMHISLLIVHVVTVYFAWQIGGWLAALITFVTPPFAEIFWAFATWMKYGHFFNLFTDMCLAVVVGYIALMIIAMLGSLLEPKAS